MKGFPIQHPWLFTFGVLVVTFAGGAGLGAATGALSLPVPVRFVLPLAFGVFMGVWYVRARWSA